MEEKVPNNKSAVFEGPQYIKDIYQGSVPDGLKKAHLVRRSLPQFEAFVARRASEDFTNHVFEVLHKMIAVKKMFEGLLGLIILDANDKTLGTAS